MYKLSTLALLVITSTTLFAQSATDTISEKLPAGIYLANLQVRIPWLFPAADTLKYGVKTIPGGRVERQSKKTVVLQWNNATIFNSKCTILRASLKDIIFKRDNKCGISSFLADFDSTTFSILKSFITTQFGSYDIRSGHGYVQYSWVKNDIKIALLQQVKKHTYQCWVFDTKFRFFARMSANGDTKWRPR